MANRVSCRLPSPRWQRQEVFVAMAWQRAAQARVRSSSIPGLPSAAGETEARGLHQG